MKHLISLFIAIISLSCFQAALLAKDNHAFPMIEELLVEKGLDRKRVNKLLKDPRISINEGILIKNLFHSSPKGTAKRPDVMEIAPAYIKKGKAFIKSRSKTFDQLKKRFGVPAEVITAILIVESRLGTYPERYNVFLAYTNLSVAVDTDYLPGISDKYKGRYPAIDDKATIEKARKKGSWAINQLYQLILLCDDLKLDPLSIKGSFAGAMGPGQFIPSSFMEYGVDGDNDGKRDPFNMRDAMASIANYIKLAGWKEKAGNDKKRRAIWCYNHSEVYVNTIMMLYRELSKK